MSTRESGSDRTTCRLTGEDAVTKASDAARVFGQAQWLAEDEISRLCIIVEELIANLYDHGGVGGEDEVTLTLVSNQEGITLTILDPGKPFDPRLAKGKAGTTDRGGGAGIDIVRAWALVTDYRTSPDGNRLELLLPVPR